MKHLLLMLLCVCSASVHGDTLPAAGDGRHVWIAAAADDSAQFTLWHRGPGGRPNVVREVEQLRGWPQNVGAAAVDGELWLVYRDGTVQSITAARSPVDNTWRFSATRQYQLNRVFKLRSLQATAAGPWALVRVESAEQLDLADKDEADVREEAEDDPVLRNLVLELPIEMDEQPSAGETKNDSASEDVEVTPSAQGEPAEVISGFDGLLRLTGSGWRRVGLPEDWPHLSRSALLFDARRSDRPMLLVQLQEGDRLTKTLRVYTWEDEAWSSEEYQLHHTARWSAALVDGQIVLAQQPSRGDDLRLLLSVLRGGEAVVLSPMTLPVHADADWSVFVTGDSIGLLAYDPPTEEDATGIHFASMDLAGRTVRDAVVFEADAQEARANWLRSMTFVGVVVLSMLMLFVFWQRDPRDNTPRLPKDLMIGTLSRRAAAGALDLAGPIAGVMFYEGLDIASLYARWPGVANDPLAMGPAIVAIGIFLAHVTLCELWFASSLGKKVVGLKVTTLDGKRPKLWQLFVRNALKLFDLVAQLLLLLPMLSPMRQRLGDLVAKTIVVMPASEEESEPTDDV